MTQLGTISGTVPAWSTSAVSGKHPSWVPRAIRVERALRRMSGTLSRGGIGGLAGLAGRGLGLLYRYPAHRRWMKIVGGRTTAQLLVAYPRIAYRHSTTYLFEGAEWPLRLSLLRTHYGFLNTMLDSACFGTVIGPSGLPVWKDQTTGRDLAIALVGPCTVSRHREGELGLHFSMDGTVLYKIAFSVVATSDLAPGGGRSRHALFVGQVQGGRDCRDLLREAARLCLDNAPRDLLMSALAGIAQAWNIDLVLGVDTSRSLSRGTCGFDHNAFWTQHGGEPTPGGHYALPLPFHEGAPQASSAAHRRRTRRKRTYKNGLIEAVADTMRGLRQPPWRESHRGAARPLLPVSPRAAGPRGVAASVPA